MTLVEASPSLGNGILHNARYNEIMWLAATWMESEDTRVSEISQRKVKYQMP